MMNWAQNFGRGVKGVIGGMILGIFLLPVGVYMQYCSVNQMQYHKVFDDTVSVTGATDEKISGDSVKIKTEGQYILSEGPFTVRTNEGNTFSGQYITYSLEKWVVKEVRKEKKDSEGKVVRDSSGNPIYEISYEWEKESDLESSPSGVSVTVNGFRNLISDFRQTYIPARSAYFEYAYGQNSYGYSVDAVREIEGAPSSPSQADYTSGKYAVVLNGRLYDNNDTTMTVSGVASRNSGSLSAIIKKTFASPEQSMMVLSYLNMAETRNKLESDAKGERLMKFILGTVFFVIGFTGIFGPIIKIFELIPFLGKLANGIIYFVVAVVSVLLSVLFYVFFQFFWVLVALAILIPIVLIILKKKAKNPA